MIIEVGAMLIRRSPARGAVTVVNLLGGTLGLAVMYGTALLV